MKGHESDNPVPKNESLALLQVRSPKKHLIVKPPEQYCGPQNKDNSLMKSNFTAAILKGSFG